MRKYYRNILKSFFCDYLVKTRLELKITQSKMADFLHMDDRSYIELEHGNYCCSAITLVLFLIFCCHDSLGFLAELKSALQKSTDDVA